MEYKTLERDAKLGEYNAKKKLEERYEFLEELPIRDDMGYKLTWAPSKINQKLLDDIDKMYGNISVTDIDTDISIETESFHSCRIEGADTTKEELFEIFKAKRTEKKATK